MAKNKKTINTDYKPVNYPVGDFLIKIKNAALVNKKQISYPYSKLVYAVSQKLIDLGFLDKVEKEDNELMISLKYHKKEPIIMSIKLVSRPGLRIYKSAQELDDKKGPSVYIVTTNKGVLSDAEAVKKNIGGEVIAEIL